MNEQKLRVALVGLDHWYSAISFAEEVAECPDTELIVIAHTDRQRANEVADKVSCSDVTTDLQGTAGRADVDMVASYVSVDQNPAICRIALEGGKHIVSVKPVAMAIDEAAEIVRLVRKAGVIFVPSESRPRWAEGNGLLKSWISQGRFGQLITSKFTTWSSLPQEWPGVTSSSGWWVDSKRAPGGGWGDHSIYHIDLLRWLMGSEVKEVSGVARNLKYPELPVEDYGIATVEFDNGVIASIEDTWTASPGGFRGEWSLVGTQGSVVFDSLSGRLWLSGSNFSDFPGWIQAGSPGRGGSGVNEIVEVIRGQRIPEATAEDAYANLAAYLAFYESANSGSKMTTPARLSV